MNVPETADMDDERLVPESLTPNTPSAKIAFLFLHRADSALTTAEIAERSSTPEVSVRNGLRELREEDVVESFPDPHDLRRKRHRLV